MSERETHSGARRFQSLDALRGFAALAVVIGHFTHVLPQFGDRPYAGHLNFAEWFFTFSPLRTLIDGHAAVLVFFVLSGFVLSGPLMAPEPVRYGAFALKRFLRLYPPYAAAIVLAAVLQAVLGARVPHGPSQWLGYNWNEALTPGLALDYALMLGRHIALDNPVWSLDYEMRLSLALPLLLLPGRRWPLATPVLAALCLAAGSVMPQDWVGRDIIYGGMFLLGATLAAHTARIRSLSPGIALLLAGTAWALLYLSWREAVQAIGAAALVACVIAPGLPERICESSLGRFLGRVSFSLYLVHVPVLMAVLAFTGTESLLRAAMVFAPSVLLVTVAFYRFVELPSHGWSRRIRLRASGARNSRLQFGSGTGPLPAGSTNAEAP